MRENEYWNWNWRHAVLSADAGLLVLIIYCFLVSLKARVSNQSELYYPVESYIPREQLEVHRQLNISRDMLIQFYVVEQRVPWNKRPPTALWLLPERTISAYSVLSTQHTIGYCLSLKFYLKYSFKSNLNKTSNSSFKSTLRLMPVLNQHFKPSLKPVFLRPISGQLAPLITNLQSTFAVSFFEPIRKYSKCTKAQNANKIEHTCLAIS